MCDLGWMRAERPRAGAAAWPLEDLDVLYCRTKVAEAQAEECGFAGTAAALAAIAAAMATQHGPRGEGPARR